QPHGENRENRGADESFLQTLIHFGSVADFGRRGVWPKRFERGADRVEGSKHDDPLAGTRLFRRRAARGGDVSVQSRLARAERRERLRDGLERRAALAVRFRYVPAIDEPRERREHAV